MSKNPNFISIAGVVMVSAIAAGCGNGEDRGSLPAAGEPLPAPAITVADVGFATPESVLHDEVADVYLVSNINGSPTAADGNGFISAVSPTGEVLALKWIDGASPGVTLNAPKGMAIADQALYVADIDCIRIFDRRTGAPVGEACVDGASFLNDVAPARDGGILFTDTGLDPSFAPAGTDAVYRRVDGQVSTVIADPGLGAPNGLIDTDDGIVVVTFMSGEVYRIDPTGSRTVLAPASQGQFDGVVELDDGRILISSWGDSCIYALGLDGTMECVVSNLEAPADIGVDLGRNRVLIPLFNANAVVIQAIR